MRRGSVSGFQSAVGVEVTFLLGQRLVEHLIDQRQRLAHGEGMARGIKHAAEAGVDRHAGADGGLGQVHRGDIAALQVDQRRRQFVLEGGEKLAAGSISVVTECFAYRAKSSGGQSGLRAFLHGQPPHEFLSARLPAYGH